MELKEREKEWILHELKELEAAVLVETDRQKQGFLHKMIARQRLKLTTLNADSE